MKLLILMIGLAFFHVSPLSGGEAKQAIEVFPSTPFYQYIIYETLVIFWIAIIGLIIIIRMKLREIERVQKMGLDKDEQVSYPDQSEVRNSTNKPSGNGVSVSHMNST